MSRALVDQGGLPHGGAVSDPQILDPECGSQRSWLYTVARNIVIDELDRHLVVAALGRLTQEHRHVLRECYFRGSSVAEAAHALGITPDTVKSRVYYALRALRLAIEELGSAE
jgi:RNA polymerase sigma-70 factor (ECF subfamily)